MLNSLFKYQIIFQNLQIHLMSSPTLLKASLKNHSPQQIYNYLFQHFGKLGIKVKYKQAIIGFQNQQNFRRIVEEHRVISLGGKRLQFIPIVRQDEVVWPTDMEEEDPNDNNMIDQNKPGIYFPEFEPLNQVEQKLKQTRISMMNKVEQKFLRSIQISRLKTDELIKKIPDKDIRERQLKTLNAAINKKSKIIQAHYQNEVNKFQTWISKYEITGEKQAIDLEPTFAIAQSNPAKNLTIGQAKLKSSLVFANHQDYLCKRLFSLNSEEFIVTTNKSIPPPPGQTFLQPINEGYIKIYNTKKAECKAFYKSEYGAYGLTRFDKLILAGTYKNSIISINLDEEEITCQNFKISSSFEQERQVISELKNLSKNKQSHIVAALGHPKFIKILEITDQEVAQGIHTISIEKRNSWVCDYDITSCQVYNDNNLLMGMGKKLVNYNVEQNIAIPFEAQGHINKIKKFNNYVFALGMSNTIKLFDIRSESIVQSFRIGEKDIKAMDIWPNHNIIYGFDRQIGMLDDRKCNSVCWANNTIHNGTIYDILRINDQVISCDKSAGIYCWNLAGFSEIF